MRDIVKILLQCGLNTDRGIETYPAVAAAYGLKHTDLIEALGDA